MPTRKFLYLYARNACSLRNMMKQLCFKRGAPRLHACLLASFATNVNCDTIFPFPIFSPILFCCAQTMAKKRDHRVGPEAGIRQVLRVQEVPVQTRSFARLLGRGDRHYQSRRGCEYIQMMQM